MKMTSTSINVGLETGNKLSSRVMKPPGGGHTDIFGKPEPEVFKPNRNPASTIVLGDEPSPVSEPKENGSSKVPNDAPKNDVQEEPVKKEETVNVPPKRVRVPPGGFSSGLW